MPGGKKKQALAMRPVHAVPIHKIHKRLNALGLNHRAKHRKQRDLQYDPDVAREGQRRLAVEMTQGAGEKKTQRIRSKRDHECSRQVFINDPPDPKQNDRNAAPCQKIELQECGLIEISLAESIEHSDMLMPPESQVNAT